jgi:outer membrane protein assembly factor BamB
VGSGFGTVDLRTGEFVPIPVSPGLADLGIGDGLVQGWGRSMLSLAFSGDLDKIDPITGEVSRIGETGLADCSAPGSYAPNCANYIGRLDGTIYVTDFAQNLYCVDPRTGATRLIGPTEIPALTFAPFSENPDGSANVFGESVFSFHGKLYVYFVTVANNFGTNTYTPLIPGAIYEINPATGKTRVVTPTDSTLSSIVNVDDTLYAFDAFTGQIAILNLANGHTKSVSVVHGAACDDGPPTCVIAGATAAQPSSHEGR